MLMRICAVVLVLVIFTVTRSEGIKCYTCNSAVDEGCGDPFKSAKATTSCAQCVKTKAEASGQKVVIRTCSSVDTGSNGCKKEELHGTTAEVCLCKGDLCNTSSHVTVSMATCIAAGTLVFLFKNLL